MNGTLKNKGKYHPIYYSLRGINSLNLIESDQIDNYDAFCDAKDGSETASSFTSAAHFKGSQVGMEDMDYPDEGELQQNPYIMTEVMTIGPHSFVDSRQGANKLAPPPKYFDSEYLRVKFALPSDRNEILDGYETTNNGGLVCNNLEFLEK